MKLLVLEPKKKKKKRTSSCIVVRSSPQGQFCINLARSTIREGGVSGMKEETKTKIISFLYFFYKGEKT